MPNVVNNEIYSYVSGQHICYILHPKGSSKYTHLIATNSV